MNVLARRHPEPAWNPEADWTREDPVPEILAPPASWSVLTLVAVVAIGLVLGLGSAYIAIERGTLFGAMKLGPWRAYPTEGTPAADPYSEAMLARTGRVPLASGEGLAFFAETDSNGRRLDPACDYRLEGKTAPSRLWTLAALDGRFRMTRTIADRPGLTTYGLLRRPDGSFSIIAAPFARPGNWLPTTRGANGLVFVLRLYDTPLTTGSGVADVDMPAIVRERCP